jgi:Bacterial RNA polymerase, alpha chain C terminal domain
MPPFPASLSLGRIASKGWAEKNTMRHEHPITGSRPPHPDHRPWRLLTRRDTMHVNELGLSAAALACLKAAGITTTEQLTTPTATELLDAGIDAQASTRFSVPQRLRPLAAQRTWRAHPATAPARARDAAPAADRAPDARNGSASGPAYRKSGSASCSTCTSGSPAHTLVASGQYTWATCWMASGRVRK